jgi:hypothetical protein
MALLMTCLYEIAEGALPGYLILQTFCLILQISSRNPVFTRSLLRICTEGEVPMSSELASLIEANTRIDGCSFPTPIPGLHLSRYSSPTQPGQGVQCPTLAIVAQGSKQLMLGDEAFTYDPGHYWKSHGGLESKAIPRHELGPRRKTDTVASDLRQDPTSDEA